MSALLKTFESAAADAQAAEMQYRAESVQRIAQLERERAFAFRRLNLLKAIAGAVRQAEKEEDAVPGGLALLRDRLNWAAVDEARNEVLTRFSPVVSAMVRAVRQQETSAEPAAGQHAAQAVAAALAEFEAWYLDHRRNAFWVLFEQELPELPLVEV